MSTSDRGGRRGGRGADEPGNPRTLRAAEAERRRGDPRRAGGDLDAEGERPRDRQGEPEARSGRARIADDFAREFGTGAGDYDRDATRAYRVTGSDYEDVGSGGGYETGLDGERSPDGVDGPEERGRDAEYEVRRRARATRARTAPRGSDTGARIRHAVPAIAFAILINLLGGIWFVIGLFALGVVALHELYGLMRRVRPIDLAGFLGLAALLLTAYAGGREAMVVALVVLFPITFLLAIARPHREHVAWGIAATMFGVLWIGVALAHAVLLRELDHGGALVTDVLIGTFIGDTCAYFGGRAWGRRTLAPEISPSKTLEGLIAGVVGGTIAFWGFAVAYQDFIAGTDALIIAFCVALAAPIGDLFQSLLKRDLDTKDTGGFFGAHGGVLDRLDGIFFTAVVGYYASLAVL